MRKLYPVACLGSLLASIALFTPGCHSSSSSDAEPPIDDAQPPGDRGKTGDAMAFTSKVSIIVEPSDSAAGLIAAIKGATKSVHMTMYLLTDSAIISALIARKNAGVDVKVILNQSFPGSSTNNSSSYSQLSKAGVSVHWSWAAFTLTHEKCVIIDGTTAWIMTMNAAESSLTDNREFLAIDTDPADVAQAEAIFAADFANTEYKPSGKLLVAPVNADEGLIALIDMAKSTLDIEAETLSDADITAKLAAAAKRGVKVQIVLADENPTSAQSNAVTQLKAAGVKLVTLAKPYMHAKSMVVDSAKCYVGSINYTNNSIFHNRELGVVFDTPSEVTKVLNTTRSDFTSGGAL
jgi:cardiolipin synthase A/B